MFVAKIKVAVVSMASSVSRNVQALALAALALILSVPAYAADPTYTSQIQEAFEAITMTTIIDDVASFAGMGFTLILTTLGVFFAARLVGRFFKTT